MNEINSYFEKRKQEDELEKLVKYSTGYGFFIAGLDKDEEGNKELAERLYRKSLDIFISDLDKIGIDAFDENLGYEFLEDNMFALAEKYGLKNKLLDVAEKAYFNAVQESKDYKELMELKEIWFDLKHMERDSK